MLPLLLYFFFFKSNFVSVSLHIATEITSSYRTENLFYVLCLHHMGNTIWTLFRECCLMLIYMEQFFFWPHKTAVT